jgi:hypothetical protein
MRRAKHSRPRHHRCNLVSRLYGRVPGLTTLRSERVGRKGSFPYGIIERPVPDKSLPRHSKVPSLRQCCNIGENEAGLCAGTHDRAGSAVFQPGGWFLPAHARRAATIRPRRGGACRETSHEHDRIPGGRFIVRDEAALRCHPRRPGMRPASVVPRPRSGPRSHDIHRTRHLRSAGILILHCQRLWICSPPARPCASGPRRRSPGLTPSPVMAGLDPAIPVR